MTDKPRFQCWLDFETNSLDKQNLTVLEVAWEVTDWNLVSVASGHGLFWHPDGWRNVVDMEPEVHAMHLESGLIESLDRQAADTVQPEMERLIALLTAMGAGKYVEVSLAGSGVAQFDRPIIDLRWPALSAMLTYWPLDTGPTRRMALYANVAGKVLGIGPNDPLPHRAEADIRYAQMQYAAFMHFLKNWGH